MDAPGGAFPFITASTCYPSGKIHSDCAVRRLRADRCIGFPPIPVYTDVPGGIVLPEVKTGGTFRAYEVKPVRSVCGFPETLCTGFNWVGPIGLDLFQLTQTVAVLSRVYRAFQPFLATTRRTASAIAAASSPYSAARSFGAPLCPKRSLIPIRSKGTWLLSASTSATAEPRPP